MKHRTLYEKIQNKEYLNNLSDRRQRELLFCAKILNEEELMKETSIQIGYEKARKKFIMEYLDKINPELAERALENKRVPLFNMLDIIEELGGK